ncbi:MAG: DUF4145 domain-containing protein [bacterium]
MIFKVQSYGLQKPSAVISLRCPNCRQQGTFSTIGNAQDVLLPPSLYLGQRQCPNPSCLAHVFFAWDSGKLLTSYPAERIDFDSTAIPPAVVSALEEAITCHANRCFVASAIMIGKTLEELCRDRGATGKNLKERLTALGTKIVLPQELLNGLDNMRLLGNDAAHIDSKEYQQVGQEEVEVGIMFAKEVLKAVYQYTTLLDRLKSLKKIP